MANSILQMIGNRNSSPNLSSQAQQMIHSPLLNAVRASEMGLSFYWKENAMNLLYYNTQIKEELEDAAAYIKKACCLKASNKEKAEKVCKA